MLAIVKLVGQRYFCNEVPNAQFFLKPGTTKATLLARLQCHETDVQGGKLILNNLGKYQMQNYIGC